MAILEHGECDGCVYEHTEKYREPCVRCRCCVEKGTLTYYGRINLYVPKDKSSNCTISCKECNKYFTNEDYGFKEISKDEVDMVNHPQHYAHGIEPIDYIESHDFNFNLGNVIKYVSRAPYKGTELEDLQKAKWYLEREIKKHDNYRND